MIDLSCPTLEVKIYLGSWNRNGRRSRIGRDGVTNAINDYCVAYTTRYPTRVTETYFVGSHGEEAGWEIVGSMLPGVLHIDGDGLYLFMLDMAKFMLDYFHQNRVYLVTPVSTQLIGEPHKSVSKPTAVVSEQ